MDPVSALGVATSAWDFLKDIYAYYQVWKGCDDDIAELRVRLLALQAIFGATKDALKRPGLSSEDHSLVEQALKSCDPAVQDLKQTLDKFKKNDGQPQTAWQKLKATGRKAAYPFQSSTVQGLMEDLEQCQRNLSATTTLLGLNTGSTSLERMQALDDKIVNHFSSIDDSLKDLKLAQGSIEARIAKDLANNAISIHAQIEQTQAELQETRRAVIRQLETGEEKRKAREIIASLDHEHLHRRRRAIAESHPCTLHWLLDPQQSEFAEWLKSGSGIFWIKGKAGSGKSTLMKFISEQPETEELLESWAGSDPLMIVEHFFWIAGSEWQRSCHGLLQNILYQILQGDPAVVPKACKKRWGQNHAVSREWKTQELRDALKLAVNHTRMRICFLIDGLDEYDPPREHASLTRMLLDLSKPSHVKIIVSSRPWKAFETSLMSHAHPVLLEDVNHRDIVQYTKQRLLEGSDDSILQQLDWTAIEERKYLSHEIPANHEAMWLKLIVSVVQRSQGVFLWTSLVLDAISERLAALQSLDVIYKHVNDFPSELEEYFRTLVFNRVNDTWLSETAMMLRITVVLDDYGHAEVWEGRGEPVSNPHFSAAWLLASENFGKEFLNDPDFAQHILSRSFLAEGRQATVALVKNFIHACCKDLLVVEESVQPSAGASERVDLSYTHRTVYDFVRTPDMEVLINAHVPQHFRDGYLNSRLMIADIKLQASRRALFAAADTMAFNSMYSRRGAHLKTMPASLLHEHGKLAVQIAKATPFSIHIDHSEVSLLNNLVLANHPWYALDILQHFQRIGATFKMGLSHSTREQGTILRTVLKYIITESRSNRCQALSLLELVLSFRLQEPNTVERSEWFLKRELNLPTTRQKLKFKPALYRDLDRTMTTPWEFLLQEVAQIAQGNGFHLELWEAVKIMIRYGADLHALISLPSSRTAKRDRGIRHHTAVNVLRESLPDPLKSELETLLNVFLQPSVHVFFRSSFRRWIVDRLISQGPMSEGETVENYLQRTLLDERIREVSYDTILYRRMLFQETESRRPWIPLRCISW